MYVHRRYMATLLLWMAGIVFESLILFRMIKRRLFAHYPFFFAYMAVVLSSSIAIYLVYQSPSYSRFFWAKQFLGLLAGFGVLFEIVQKSFQKYPGARKFASVVLVMIFAILCGYFVFRLLPAEGFTKEGAASLERDFRAVQALTLCGVLVIVSYYRIDLGKNLFGITVGLTLYVAATILSNELRGYVGPAFDAGWNAIQPYTYFVSLLIWTFALWSYAPARTPKPPPEIDDGYEAFARRTKHALGTMRASVSKADQQ